MAKPKELPKCPHCGGKVIEVIYGFPRPELVEEARQGDIALGGCVISEDNPSHRCTVCGAEFVWEKPAP